MQRSNKHVYSPKKSFKLFEVCDITLELNNQGVYAVYNVEARPPDMDRSLSVEYYLSLTDVHEVGVQPLMHPNLRIRIHVGGEATPLGVGWPSCSKKICVTQHMLFVLQQTMSAVCDTADIVCSVTR